MIGEKSMKVLFWYCEKFGWNPTMKTLPETPDAKAGDLQNGIVAFIHVEPKDVADGSSAETKLAKNAKWLARKWDTREIVLHSFTHLGEEKAAPETAKGLIDRVHTRLEKAGYAAIQTPYGHFNDLSIQAPGHPLARIFKEF
jgi:hypothetical protein